MHRIHEGSGIMDRWMDGWNDELIKVSAMVICKSQNSNGGLHCTLMSAQ